MQDSNDFYHELLDDGYYELKIDVPSDIPHKCFACAPSNPVGLHMHFFAKKNPISDKMDHNRYPEDLFIVSKFRISENHCGFPRYSHGGILTTLLDEVMAHAVYHVYRKYGITKSITVNFRRPVLVNTPIYIYAQVKTLDRPHENHLKRNIHVFGKIVATFADCFADQLKTLADAHAEMVILPDDRYRLNYFED